MNTYTLYHVTPSNTREMYFAEPEDVAKVFYGYGDKGSEVYELVGLIEAVSLEDAFHKTNSIESLWTAAINPVLLAAKFRFGARSTSVGDVLVDDATGIAYHVSLFGFTMLELGDFVCSAEVTR